MRPLALDVLRITAFLLLVLANGSPAIAAEGDCGQPVGGGDRPVASDALFILRAAVGSEQCELCVCDVDNSGSTSATDALVDLKAAVGQQVPLQCPPCGATTTLPPTTTLPTTTTIPTTTSLLPTTLPPATTTTIPSTTTSLVTTTTSITTTTLVPTTTSSTTTSLVTTTTSITTTTLVPTTTSITTTTLVTTTTSIATTTSSTTATTSTSSTTTTTLASCGLDTALGACGGPCPEPSDECHLVGGAAPTCGCGPPGNALLWIANVADWGIGTISKLDATALKEVARYFTFTCFSNPTSGSRATCSGTNGCCARDDYDDYQFRLINGGVSSGIHQTVQKSNNRPSRTAVDTNGDVWIANQAFEGQSSVTKIANHPEDCVERNGIPDPQTSNDANGDGVIDSDCDRDGVADDLATVCTGGRGKEFYGFDDECVLFTTNTGAPNQIGRAVALQPGPFAGRDAWAGTFSDGRFFRIDGTTGMTEDDTVVVGTPWGAGIDPVSGILWAPTGTRLAYFDTSNPGVAHTTRTASAFIVDNVDAGIAIETGANGVRIWSGGFTAADAFMFAPDTSGGIAELGDGFWTRFVNSGSAAGALGVGYGVSADARSPGNFVWLARAEGWVVRIPAGEVPSPVAADETIDGSVYMAIRVSDAPNANRTRATAVDADGNVWGVSQSTNSATLIEVTASGDTSTPDLSGPAGAGCPTGDRCTLNLTGVATTPEPEPYSDFSGCCLPP